MTRLAVRHARNVVPASAAIERSLSRAIVFLQESQLAHGEFRTCAATNKALTVDCHPDSACFITALVLYAIGSSDDPRVPALIARGLDFLAAEMEGQGMWRYWSSRNARHNYLPPDLDDTCCISFLLKKYSRPLPANESLILGNRNAHGVFYTWLSASRTLPSKFVSKRVREQIRQVSDPDVELVMSLSGTLGNIDCAVNANVLLYLGESSATQSAIDYVIETVLDDRVHARSTYYLHSLSLYYLVSRAFINRVSSLEKTRATIVRRLESAQANSGAFGNALSTALAACALLNFGEASSTVDRAVQSLLQAQNPDGSWARHAMFLGPAPYYGSEELTTALGIEALTRYRDSK